MRILFLGSKDLGCDVLQYLVEQGEKVVGVVPRYDDPKPGMWFRSVTEVAEKNQLHIYKTPNVNRPTSIAIYKALKPDLILSVFCPQIMKPEVLEIPAHSYGAINLHFAPLPRYRGSMPGPWAMINGETQFGVTMHYIAPGVDNGDIIAQKMLSIFPEDNGLSLYRRCEVTGMELFRETWPLIKSKTNPRLQQDECQALYFPRGVPYDRTIRWDWSAVQVVDYVRALDFPPFEPAGNNIGAERLMVSKARVYPGELNGHPGEVLGMTDRGTVLVKAGDHVVELLEFSLRSRPREDALTLLRSGAGIDLQ